MKGCNGHDEPKIYFLNIMGNISFNLLINKIYLCSFCHCYLTYFTNSNDEEVKVLAKEEKSFDKGIVVYNLNIEDYHTYYVGSNNVLVHNKCWVDDVVKDSNKAIKNV